jgi:hypothetical protein
MQNQCKNNSQLKEKDRIQKIEKERLIHLH